MAKNPPPRRFPVDVVLRVCWWALATACICAVAAATLAIGMSRIVPGPCPTCHAQVGGPPSPLTDDPAARLPSCVELTRAEVAAARGLTRALACTSAIQAAAAAAALALPAAAGRSRRALAVLALSFSAASHCIFAVLFGAGAALAARSFGVAVGGVARTLLGAAILAVAAAFGRMVLLDFSYLVRAHDY